MAIPFTLSIPSRCILAHYAVALQGIFFFSKCCSLLLLCRGEGHRPVYCKQEKLAFAWKLCPGQHVYMHGVLRHLMLPLVRTQYQFIVFVASIPVLALRASVNGLLSASELLTTHASMEIQKQHKQVKCGSEGG